MVWRCLVVTTLQNYGPWLRPRDGARTTNSDDVMMKMSEDLIQAPHRRKKVQKSEKKVFGKYESNRVTTQSEWVREWGMEKKNQRIKKWNEGWLQEGLQKTKKYYTQWPLFTDKIMSDSQKTEKLAVHDRISMSVGGFGVMSCVHCQRHQRQFCENCCVPLWLKAAEVGNGKKNALQHLGEGKNF